MESTIRKRGGGESPKSGAGAGESRKSKRRTIAAAVLTICVIAAAFSFISFGGDESDTGDRALGDPGPGEVGFEFVYRYNEDIGGGLRDRGQMNYIVTGITAEGIREVELLGPTSTGLGSLGDAGTVSIPDFSFTIGFYEYEYVVTSIGDDAFLNSTVITHFYTGGTVTSIGDWAFSGCTNLTTIDLSSVTEIGDYAFHRCTNLESADLSSVTHIGGWVFTYSGLTHADLSSVTHIGAYAFNSAQYLESVNMPDRAIPILDHTFNGCSKLANIDLRMVTSVGDNAFTKCSSLTHAELYSVTSLGVWAFSSCSALESITIPSWITVIPDCAFSGCTKLAALALPYGTDVGTMGNQTIPNSTVKVWYETDNISSMTAVKTGTQVELLILPDTGKDITQVIVGSSRGASNVTVSGSGPWTFTAPGSDYYVKATTYDILYHVTYDLNGGTGAVPLEGDKIYQATFAAASAAGVIAPTNRLFKEWNTISDGSGTAYASGATVTMPAEDLVLYAVWKADTGHTFLQTDENGNSLEYIVLSGTAQVGVNGYTYASGALTIPSHVCDPDDVGSIYTVTSIRDEAFMDCYGLESVIIPDTVTSIGDWAFAVCTSLEAITIPDTVISIGDWAFSDCHNMGSVTIGSSVETIGACAFAVCKSLETITIPASVTSIPSSAFRDCTALTQISVHASNTDFISIDGVLFNSSVSKLIAYPAYRAGASYTIPGTVTSIESYAFDHCMNLQSVDLGSVTSIGVHAFIGSVMLRSIDLSSVTSIESYAFWGVNLDSVDLSSAIYIGSSAFYGCTGLESVTISDSIATIGDHAFYGCTSLAAVAVPYDTAVGTDWVPVATIIVWYEGASCITATQEVVMVELKISVPTGKKVSAVLIGTSYGDYDVDTIPVPSWGFDPEPFGTAKNFFAAVEYADLYAVTYDKNGGEGDAPIERYVAAGDEFIVEPPSGLTAPENTEFKEWNTQADGMGDPYTQYQLATMTAGPLTLFAIWKGLVDFGFEFTGSDGNVLLYVIKAYDSEVSVIGYVTVSGHLEIPDSVTFAGISYDVTSIEDNAFFHCTGLTQVMIPYSVQHIGNGAFSACTSLKDIHMDEKNEYYASSVGVLFDNEYQKLLAYPGGRTGHYTVPGTVMSIGAAAFSGCTGLISIDLNQVTIIESGAFSGCTGLISIDLSMIETLGSSVFYGCTDLESVDLGGYTGLISGIEERTFQDCSSLKAIIIPFSVAYIDDHAFSGCTSLEEVNILLGFPSGSTSGVTRIGDYAFSGCTSLVLVTIPSTVEDIGDYAFSGCTSLTVLAIPYGVIEGYFGDHAVPDETLIVWYKGAPFVTADAADEGDAIELSFIVSYSDRASVTVGTSHEGDDVATITAAPWKFDVSSDREYFAKISFVRVYAVTYYLASDSGTGTGTVPTEEPKAYNETFLTASADGLTPPSSEMRFKEWNTLSNGSGTSYYSGEEVTMGTSQIVLYAIWEIIPTHAVTYGENGGSGSVPAETDKKEGEKFTAGSASELTPPSDMQFKWWNTAANDSGDSYYPGEEVTMPDGPLVLYAIWTSIPSPSSPLRVGEWVYTAQGPGEVHLTGWNTSPSGNITIPGLIIYDDVVYTVTGIGYLWASGCTSLTSVTLPDSVTYIGVSAFSGCTWMEFINLGHATYIGERAFYNTRMNLAETIDLSSVTHIGIEAFANAAFLKTVTIGSSVGYIGNYAFYGTSINALAIPYSVKDYCGTGLVPTQANIIWYEGATSVTADKTSGQAELSIPLEAGKGVTDITVSTTRGGPGIALTGSGPWTFTVSSGLEYYLSVTIGDVYSVKYILASGLGTGTGTVPAEAFMEEGDDFEVISASGLTPPPGLQFKEWNTLANGLGKAYAPGDIVTVETEDITLYAIWDLIPTSEFSVGSLKYSTDGANKVNVTGYVTAPSGSLTIPASVTCDGITYAVTGIEMNAFSGCINLTSVNLPDSVTSIGINAFYGCYNLSSIDLSSVTFIRIGAFQLCYQLGSVDLSSATSIEINAFSGCTSLTSVHIPASVTIIEAGAFSGCTDLISITVDPSNANFISRGGVLLSADESTLKQYPAGKTDKHYEIQASVTTIESTAFYGCTNLTSVDLGSVTTVGNNAFYGCTGLISVTVPVSVTSIGDHAFHNCSGLAALALPFGTTPGTDAIPDSTVIVWYEDAVSAAAVKNGSVVELSVVTYAGQVVSEIAVGTTRGGSDVAVTGSDPWRFTASGLTYYAAVSSVDAYTVTYDENLGSGTPPTESLKAEGAKFIAASAAGLTAPAGQHFMWWNTESDDSGLSYYPGAEITMPGEPLVLYAIWEVTPDPFVQNGLEYTVTAHKEVSVTNIVTYMVNVVIPDSVTFGGVTYSVTSIGYRAFYYYGGMASVSIPASVTSIGEDVFVGCGDLAHIDVDEANPNYMSVDGVLFTKDGETLVRYPANKAGASYEIPDGVIHIGESAFYQSGLESIVMPDSVKTIGDWAFGWNYYLTSVTIGPSVETIGNGAFIFCTGLESIVIPDSVTSMGQQAFQYCGSLKSVTIGSSVETISNYAFQYCGSLKSVTIGSSVETISNYAFAECSGLTSFVIPDTVKTIGDRAFNNCYNLISVTIGSSVETIGDYAFNGCNNLISVTIGSSVETIGDYAFSGCKLVSVVIPDSVKTIGEFAFAYSGLVSVTIGSSVETIGYSAFSGCGNLESVIIPDSVKTIGSWAFSNCPGLVYVVISSSVETIGFNAFSGCSGLIVMSIPDEVDLTNAGIPFGVVITNGYFIALVPNGGSYVDPITGAAGSPVTVPADPVRTEYSFGGWYSDKAFTVPYDLPGTLEAEYVIVYAKWISDRYETTFTASDGYGNILSFTVTDIDGKEAEVTGYVDLANPSYVSIPSQVQHTSGFMVTVTSIGNGAFIDNKDIQYIVTGSNVRTIGDNAFSNCTSLFGVDMAGSVISIGNGAFAGCTSLTSLSFGSSVETIGDSAFQYCTALESVTIPDSVISIGDFAFVGCTSLTYVYIGSSVETIGNCAFADCGDLVYIVIPDSVTSIGNNAFDECYGLLIMSIPAGLDHSNAGIPSGVVITDGYFIFVVSSGGSYVAPIIETPGTEISRPDDPVKAGYVFRGWYTNKAATSGYTFPDIMPSDYVIVYAGWREALWDTLLVDDENGNSLRYMITDIENMEAALTGYDDITNGNIVIPDSVEYPSGSGIYYSVKAIEGSAFNRASLTSVTIGPSVEIIWNDAFAHCAGLTSVTFGSSLKNIGSYAFYYCTSLESVVIPDSVISIGASAFSNCTGLTSVTFGSSLETIGDRAFSSCTSLESVTIPDSVISIGASAFSNCTGLTSVTFGSSLETIGDNAFYYCENLESVIIPDSVISIGAGTFSNCTGLTSVTFGSSLETIGDNAFYNCYNIGSLVIPDSVKTIGYTAFSYCTGLIYAVIGSSTETIGDDAFLGCSNLIVMSIPAGLDYAGAGLSSSVVVTDGYFIVFISNGGSSVALITGALGSDVSVPADPTRSGYLFGGWYSDKALTVPYDFPDTMPAEYTVAYADWIISYTVTYNLNGASYGTPPTESPKAEGGEFTVASMPSSVSPPSNKYFIGWNTLANGTGTSYYPEDVITMGTSPITLYAIWASSYFTYDGLQYSVTGASEVSLTQSTAATGSVNIPASVTCDGITYAVTSIEAGALYNRNVTSVTIPDTVISIGDGAFQNCTGLTSVTIGSSVETIGDSAFQHCYSLEYVVIPDSVISIGDWAFHNCYSLEYVVIPDSVISIGDRAFSECSGLVSVKIGESVETIGDYAFSSCTSLTSVTFGSSVKSIGDWAFYNCYSLEYVVIPDSVIYIRDGAFEFCTSMIYAVIGSSAEVIENIAFGSCGNLMIMSIPAGLDYSNAGIHSGVVITNGYFILLVPNGGTSTDPITGAFGSDVSVPADPTRSGYLFGGWYSDKALTVPYDFPDTMPAEYTVAYADWIVSYTVTYNLNGGYGGSPPTESPKAEGGEFTVASMPTSVSPPSSKHFIGWNTASDGSGWSYDPGDVITMGTSPITLYAIWQSSAGAIFYVDDENGNNLAYRVITVGTEVEVYGTGGLNGGNVVIPEKVKRFDEPWIEYSVTGIRNNAFYYLTGLRSVIIPDSVTHIGNSAFYNCTSLVSVTIGSSVETIGDSAFQNCTGLTSVTIGSSVETIGDWAFYYCTSLETITIPDSVIYIGNGAFYECTSLISIVIPDSVISIGYSAFTFCTSLETVTIGSSVEYIGDDTFAVCTSLTSVVIPDSVISIGYSAFEECMSLVSVTIGSSVEYIGGYVFYGCTSLTSVVIPDSVTYIGEYAFYGCTSLQSAKIGDSVESIQYGMFIDCTSLRTVTIGSSVEYMGWNAFYGCTSLTEINVNTENEYYMSIDGVLFTKDGEGLINYPAGKTAESYKIPDPVMWIEDCAFQGCAALKYVTFGPSVEWIGYSAFELCTGLVSIEIPDSVTWIGGSAFYGCTSLEYVKIGKSLEGISYSMFEECTSLETVNIPDSVTYIDECAFYGCISLTSIEIPDSVEWIEWGAFYGCTSLETVTIGSSMDYIGWYAFYNCTSLISMVIPDSVTYIGNYAFDGCENLIVISIPFGVTSGTDAIPDTTVVTNDYFICLVPNGGSYVVPITGPQGMMIDALPVTTLSGHVLEGWYSDKELTIPYVTPITMPARYDVVYAKWVPGYTVTVEDGTGSGEYAAGATVMITADEAPEGMMFSGWTAVGVTLSNPGAASTSFIMPARAVTVTANYEDLPEGTYSVTVDNDGNGTAGADKYSAAAGEEVTLTATPMNSHYRFKEWQVVPDGVTITNNKFIMPSENVTVTAVFELITYTLSVVNGTGSGGYEPDELITIKADAAPLGMAFDRWTTTPGGVFADEYDQETLFRMPSNAVTVTANYKNVYAVTVNSGTGDGNFAAGDTVTITAGAAPSGKVFDRWTTSDGFTFANASSATTTFIMPAKAVTVTATYKDVYAVTVTNGTGGGNFAADTTVTITAGAAPSGKVFDRWASDDVTFANASSATTTFTMPAKTVTVTATYRDITYGVTVNGGTGGGNFVAGVTVTITANAAPAGQVFDKWTTTSGAITFADENSMTTTFMMPAGAVTITATYKPIPTYAVTVNSGTGGGSFVAGVSVSITADAAPAGQIFDKWVTSDDVTFANASSVTTMFIMPAEAVTVTATYKDVYAVMVIKGTGDGEYAVGTVVNVTADVAPAGMMFIGWTTEDITLENPGDASTSFTMPANAVTVTANYADLPEDAHAVNVQNDGNGTAVADVNHATPGEEVTLTVNPNSGYRFKEWQVTPVGVTITNNKFIMPSYDVTITAVFEIITYTVTVVSGTGSGDYAPDDVVTITAATVAGKVFDGWTASDGLVIFADANSATTTFAMPAEAVTVTANYRDITYTVTYDLNGGSGVPPSESDKAAGATFTAKPGVGLTPPAAGLTFRGWNTGSDASGTAYASGATVTMPSEALVLYAIWEYAGTTTKTWITGSTGDLEIIVPGNNYSKFAGVMLGDKLLVRNTDYTAISGSTIVTLKAAYLQSLSQGNHIVNILFDDGIASVLLTISSPTGDDEPIGGGGSGGGSTMIIIAVIAVIAVVGLAAVYFLVIKKKP